MFVAVPSGAMTLASLGAEVIRIDPIGGASDRNRAPVAPSGTSIYWASLNKGKQSIMLDTRSEEGRELAAAIATADGPGAGLFLTNAIGEGWFSYEALRSRREDIIVVRLLGNADGRPALDYSVNWELGLPAITGPDGTSAPTMHVLPAWDLLAGTHMAISLLAAERRRALTGEGDSIVVSLADIALWGTDALGMLAEPQLGGAPRERTGDFVYGTFGTHFETAAGPPVMLVALTSRQWADLVTVTETHDRIAALEAEVGESMDDEHARWRHRVRVRKVMAPWFSARSTEDILQTLRPTRLVSSALGTFEEVVAGPMVQQNPLFTALKHRRLDPFLAMGYPATFSGASSRPPAQAPILGEHTEAVLSGVLGLSTLEIGALIDRGIAGGPDA